jgi:hypothetical protein
VLNVFQASAGKFSTLDEFIRIVSADPVSIGFKPGVVRLSRDNWTLLYRSLSGGAQ